MTLAKQTSARGASIQALMDREVAGLILRSEADVDWPDDLQPTDVRIERAWPMRDGRFAVEWSLRLGDGSRHSLFAVSCDVSAMKMQSESNCPVMTPHGLRELFVLAPQRRCQIHSPDRDPDMPHLAQCLDGHKMADLLAPYWTKVDHHTNGSQQRVECRLLGYRAGRRAAMAYRRGAPTGKAPMVVGKTYRDDRGRRLLNLHADLNRRLWQASQGRIRVPTPIGYLPDVQMALFSWSEGRKPGADSLTSTEVVLAVVDALTVLHPVPMEELPDFTVADELAIVDRWHVALERVDGRTAESLWPLLVALRRAGESTNTNRLCTVHRDLYERQLALADGVTTLLDLDTLARGNPCVDLGNLLAHLSLSTLSTTRSSDAAAPLAVDVVRRYLDGGGLLDRATLVFYWASALFRVGAIHSLRTATKAYAPALWRIAGELLECVPSGNLCCDTRVDPMAGEFDPRPILKLIGS